MSRRVGATGIGGHRELFSARRENAVKRFTGKSQTAGYLKATTLPFAVSSTSDETWRATADMIRRSSSAYECLS